MKILDKNQLSQFMIELNQFMIDHDFYNKKEDIFSHGISLWQVNYAPKAKVNNYDQYVTATKCLNFLSFYLSYPQMLNFAAEQTKLQTGHDFYEKVKVHLAKNKVNPARDIYVPYATFKERKLDNFEYGFSINDNIDLTVVLGYNNETGQYRTEDWHLELTDITKDLNNNNDLFFDLRDMSCKYWHDKEKKNAELRQVKKLKQSVNHDFTLIKKYFNEDEKKKLIKKLL